MVESVARLAEASEQTESLQALLLGLPSSGSVWASRLCDPAGPETQARCDPATCRTTCEVVNRENETSALARREMTWLSAKIGVALDVPSPVLRPVAGGV